MVHLLGPLVAKIIYHIKNSKNLAEELSEVDIDPWDMLFSHGVVSLFTNTPIPQMIDIIQGRLKSDKTLKQRTLLEVDDIIEMLKFVLNTTYFSVRGQIYQQMFGTTMGSLVSPIVANLCKEDLEQRDIVSALEDCKPKF